VTIWVNVRGIVATDPHEIGHVDTGAAILTAPR
jgi:hypothetical protein